MFHTKLTLVALLTLGLVGCTQDEPQSETNQETKAPAPAVEKAETPTQVAAAPAAKHAEGKTDEGYNCASNEKGDGHECEQGVKEHGGGCNQWDEAASAVTKRGVPDDAVWVAFDVDGMTCGGCERRIQAKVGDMKGVVAVEASSELSRVRVAFEKGSEDEAAARERVASLGYKVR